MAGDRPPTRHDGVSIPTITGPAPEREWSSRPRGNARIINDDCRRGQTTIGMRRRAAHTLVLRREDSLAGVRRL